MAQLNTELVSLNYFVVNHFRSFVYDDTQTKIGNVVNALKWSKHSGVKVILGILSNYYIEISTEQCSHSFPGKSNETMWNISQGYTSHWKWYAIFRIMDFSYIYLFLSLFSFSFIFLLIFHTNLTLSLHSMRLFYIQSKHNKLNYRTLFAILSLHWEYLALKCCSVYIVCRNKVTAWMREPPELIWLSLSNICLGYVEGNMKCQISMSVSFSSLPMLFFSIAHKYLYESCQSQNNSVQRLFN